MNIAQTILKDLKARGYSMRQVAQEVGVSWQALYKILDGSYNASQEVTSRLVETYGYEIQLVKPTVENSFRRS